MSPPSRKATPTHTPIGEDAAPKIGHRKLPGQQQGQGIVRGDAHVGGLVQGAGEAEDQHPHPQQRQLLGKALRLAEGPYKQLLKKGGDGPHEEPVHHRAHAHHVPGKQQFHHKVQAV